MIRVVDILHQNPWWKYGEDFPSHDPHLAPHVRREFRLPFFQRPSLPFEPGGIYVLRGPRQVGKTTYLKNMIHHILKQGVHRNHILYLSVDAFTSRRELRNALEYFLQMNRDAPALYMFLDEVTALPDWNVEVKTLADQGLTRRAILCLTGSSAPRLKEKGELLPGRGLEGREYWMKPLGFREFVLQTLDFIYISVPSEEFRAALDRLRSVLPTVSWSPEPTEKDGRAAVQALLPFQEELDFFFQIYLWTGGFPAVINNYLEKRYILRKDDATDPRLAEVFLRDVLGDLARLGRPETTVRRVLAAVLDRYGSRFSFSGLSRDIELNHVTTESYLELLEESFIGLVLYAYDFSRKTPKWKGEKKVYFLDPFVFHAVRSFLTGKPLQDAVAETFQDEALLGRLVEGIVVAHLARHREIPWLRPARTFLWMYYDRRGRELDALYRVDDRFMGVEVKYGVSAGVQRIRPPGPISRSLVLTRADVHFGEDLWAIPVDIFLALLGPSDRNL